MTDIPHQAASVEPAEVSEQDRALESEDDRIIFIPQPKPQPKRTVIADHCQRQQDLGHKSCIWICERQSGVTYARDIPVAFGVDDRVIGLEELRSSGGRWWKRWSFHSARGVKAVKIRPMKVTLGSGRRSDIRVYVTDIDYHEEMARIRTEIAELLPLVEDDEGSSGVDIAGTFECYNNMCAEGYYYDPRMAFGFCPHERFEKLQGELEELKWLPSEIEYYWQNGVDEQGTAALSRLGFVLCYDDLKERAWRHAIGPHIFNGFELIEGWHVKRLIAVILASVIASICVVAIGALAGNSLEMAFTMGSYAAGLAAVLIAVLSLLSKLL